MTCHSSAKQVFVSQKVLTVGISDHIFSTKALEEAVRIALNAYYSYGESSHHSNESEAVVQMSKGEDCLPRAVRVRPREKQLTPLLECPALNWICSFCEPPREHFGEHSGHASYLV